MSSIAAQPPERHVPRRRPRGAGRGPAGPAGRGPAARPSWSASPTGQAMPPSERLQRLATTFAQAFLEVEAGRRSRTQLDPLLCPLLAARLASVWVRPGPPGQVVRTRGVLVAPDRYEAVVVVRRRGRFGALGVALARHGRSWQVIDASRPEDGLLPQPPAFALPIDDDDEDVAADVGH